MGETTAAQTFAVVRFDKRCSSRHSVPTPESSRTMSRRSSGRWNARPSRSRDCFLGLDCFASFTELDLPVIIASMLVNNGGFIVVAVPVALGSGKQCRPVQHSATHNNPIKSELSMGLRFIAHTCSSVQHDKNGT